MNNESVHFLLPILHMSYVFYSVLPLPSNAVSFISHLNPQETLANIQINWCEVPLIR